MAEYFLDRKELERIADKFVRVIVKLQCYHTFDVFCGEWLQRVSIRELAGLVKRAVMSKDGYMILLCAEEKMMFSISGSTLYMSVYNPSMGAVANLSMLASAEGLFLRRAG